MSRNTEKRKIDPVTILICKISFEGVSLFISRYQKTAITHLRHLVSFLDPKSHDWSHCCCSFAVLIMHLFGVPIWDKIK